MLGVLLPVLGVLGVVWCPEELEEPGAPPPMLGQWWVLELGGLVVEPDDDEGVVVVGLPELPCEA